MSTDLPAPQDGLVSSGRRRFVLTSLSLSALLLADPLKMLRAADAKPGDEAFMAISRLITAPDAPDPHTAAALHNALVQADTGFAAPMQALAKRVVSNPTLDIEALAMQLDQAGAKDEREALGHMVSAWYLGVVADTTYAYETALMYRPTADVLSPPSYVHAGPLSWAGPTPPLTGL